MVDRDAYQHVPHGWPDQVSPPGTEDWEATAVDWLLDLLPECRSYPAMRRHPVVLAFVARHVLYGAIEGARQGYRTTRTELGELVPPHVIDDTLRDIRSEGRRLVAAARAVDLVERELRAR
jgi:hypothetical protein